MVNVTKTSIIEQTIRLMLIGLCTALQEKVLEIEDAEYLLLSPRTMRLLSQLGMSEELIALIHDGTELEDVESLLPHQLQEALSSLRNRAVSGLRRVVPAEQRSWLVNCLDQEAEQCDA